MKILYEDDDILVINKPVGVSSEADIEKPNNVLSCLASEGYKGELYTLHRLDMSVGGVMVYARNKFSAAKISDAIQNNKLTKCYLLVCADTPLEKSGVMEDILFKDSVKQKSFVVKKERKGAKKASLEYSVIKSTSDTSLVSVKLHTGRFHQIRCQFASRKMPLLGDGKYGSRDNRAKNISLFSYLVGFNHPRSDKYMEFRDYPDVTLYPWDKYIDEIKEMAVKNLF